MPRNPSPWFWKLKNTWVVNIRRKRYYLGPDKEAAFQKFHELMASKDTTPSTPKKRQSVVWLVGKFISWNEQHRSPRTVEWYEEKLGLLIKQHGSMNIDDVRPHHVSKPTRARVAAVKRLFNWAVQQGYIDSNPVTCLEKPPVNKQDRSLTDEEYEKLLEHISDQQFRDLIEFAWLTGARPQEIRILRAIHYDKRNSRMIIPIKQAKGKRKPRVIYLSTSAKAIIERLCEKNPNGMLFRNQRDEAWNRCNAAGRFYRLKKKLGCKYRLYDMRHSFATRMLIEGKDAIVVAELLGHSNTAMLATTYSHVGRDPSFLLQQLD